MKYEPEKYAPTPGAKQPTEIQAYLDRADIVKKAASNRPSKAWLITGIILMIIGLPSFIHGGFVLVIIGGALTAGYFRSNASFIHATDPLPYTPRNK